MSRAYSEQRSLPWISKAKSLLSQKVNNAANVQFKEQAKGTKHVILNAPLPPRDYSDTSDTYLRRLYSDTTTAVPNMVRSQKGRCECLASHKLLPLDKDTVTKKFLLTSTDKLPGVRWSVEEKATHRTYVYQTNVLPEGTQVPKDDDLLEFGVLFTQFRNAMKKESRRTGRVSHHQIWQN